MALRPSRHEERPPRIWRESVSRIPIRPRIPTKASCSFVKVVMTGSSINSAWWITSCVPISRSLPVCRKRAVSRRPKPDESNRRVRPDLKPSRSDAVKQCVATSGTAQHHFEMAR